MWQARGNCPEEVALKLGLKKGVAQIGQRQRGQRGQVPWARQEERVLREQSLVQAG